MQKKTCPPGQVFFIFEKRIHQSQKACSNGTGFFSRVSGKIIPLAGVWGEHPQKKNPGLLSQSGVATAQLSSVNATANNGDFGLTKGEGHAGNHVSDFHLDAVFGNDGFCAGDIGGHVNLYLAAGNAFSVHSIGIQGDDVAGHGGRESSLDLVDQLAFEADEGNIDVGLANNEANLFNAFCLQLFDQGQGQVQLAELIGAVLSGLSDDAQVLAFCIQLGSVGLLNVVQIGHDAAIGIQCNVSCNCVLYNNVGVIGAEVLVAAGVHASILGVATLGGGGLHNTLVPVMAGSCNDSLSLELYAANAANSAFGKAGLSAGGSNSGNNLGGVALCRSGNIGSFLIGANGANLLGHFGVHAISSRHQFNNDGVIDGSAFGPSVQDGVALVAVLVHNLCGGAGGLRLHANIVVVVQGSAFGPGVDNGLAARAGLGVGLGVQAGCFLHGYNMIVAQSRTRSDGLGIVTGGAILADNSCCGAGSARDGFGLDVVAGYGTTGFGLGLLATAAGQLVNSCGLASCIRNLLFAAPIVAELGTALPGISEAADGTRFGYNRRRSAGSASSGDDHVMRTFFGNCEATYHQKHSDEDDQNFLHCVPPNYYHSQRGGRYAAHPENRKLRSARITIMLLLVDNSTVRRLCYLDVGIVDVASAFGSNYGVEAVHQLTSDGDLGGLGQYNYQLAQQLSGFAENCAAEQGAVQLSNGSRLLAFFPFAANFALGASGVASFGSSGSLCRNFHILVTSSGNLNGCYNVLVAYQALGASGVANLGAGRCNSGDFHLSMSGDHATLLDDSAAGGAFDVAEFASFGAGSFLGSVHNEAGVLADESRHIINKSVSGAALVAAEGAVVPNDVHLTTNQTELVSDAVGNDVAGPAVIGSDVLHGLGNIANLALYISIARIAAVDNLVGVGAGDLPSVSISNYSTFNLDVLLADGAVVDLVGLLKAVALEFQILQLFPVSMLVSFLILGFALQNLGDGNLAAAAQAGGLVVSILFAGSSYEYLVAPLVVQSGFAGLNELGLIGAYRAVGQQASSLFTGSSNFLGYQGVAQCLGGLGAGCAAYRALHIVNAGVGAGSSNLGVNNFHLMLSGDRDDAVVCVAVFAGSDGSAVNGAGCFTNYQIDDVLVVVLVVGFNLGLGIAAAFLGADELGVAVGVAGSCDMVSLVGGLLQALPVGYAIILVVAIIFAIIVVVNEVVVQGSESALGQNFIAAYAGVGLVAGYVAGGLGSGAHDVVAQSCGVSAVHDFNAANGAGAAQAAGQGAGSGTYGSSAGNVIASGQYLNDVLNFLRIRSLNDHAGCFIYRVDGGVNFHPTLKDTIGGVGDVFIACNVYMFVISAANQALPNNIADLGAVLGCMGDLAIGMLAGCVDHIILVVDSAAIQADLLANASLAAGSSYNNLQFLAPVVGSVNGFSSCLLGAASGAAVEAEAIFGAGFFNEVLNNAPVLMGAAVLGSLVGPGLRNLGANSLGVNLFANGALVCLILRINAVCSSVQLGSLIALLVQMLCANFSGVSVFSNIVALHASAYYEVAVSGAGDGSYPLELLHVVSGVLCYIEGSLAHGVAISCYGDIDVVVGTIRIALVGYFIAAGADVLGNMVVAADLCRTGVLPIVAQCGILFGAVSLGDGLVAIAVVISILLAAYGAQLDVTARQLAVSGSINLDPFPTGCSLGQCGDGFEPSLLAAAGAGHPALAFSVAGGSLVGLGGYLVVMCLISVGSFDGPEDVLALQLANVGCSVHGGFMYMIAHVRADAGAGIFSGVLCNSLANLADYLSRTVLFAADSGSDDVAVGPLVLNLVADGAISVSDLAIVLAAGFARSLPIALSQAGCGGVLQDYVIVINDLVIIAFKGGHCIPSVQVSIGHGSNGLGENFVGMGQLVQFNILALFEDVASSIQLGAAVRHGAGVVGLALCEAGSSFYNLVVIRYNVGARGGNLCAFSVQVPGAIGPGHFIAAQVFASLLGAARSGAGRCNSLGCAVVMLVIGQLGELFGSGFNTTGGAISILVGALLNAVHVLHAVSAHIGEYTIDNVAVNYLGVVMSKLGVLDFLMLHFAAACYGANEMGVSILGAVGYVASISATFNNANFLPCVSSGGGDFYITLEAASGAGHVLLAGNLAGSSLFDNLGSSDVILVFDDLALFDDNAADAALQAVGHAVAAVIAIAISDISAGNCIAGDQLVCRCGMGAAGHASRSRNIAAGACDGLAISLQDEIGSVLCNFVEAELALLDMHSVFSIPCIGALPRGAVTNAALLNLTLVGVPAGLGFGYHELGAILKPSIYTIRIGVSGSLGASYILAAVGALRICVAGSSCALGGFSGNGSIVSVQFCAAGLLNVACSNVKAAHVLSESSSFAFHLHIVAASSVRSIGINRVPSQCSLTASIIFTALYRAVDNMVGSATIIYPFAGGVSSHQAGISSCTLAVSLGALTSAVIGMAIGTATSQPSGAIISPIIILFSTPPVVALFFRANKGTFGVLMSFCYRSYRILSKCRHHGQNHGENQNQSKKLFHSLSFILSFKSLSFIIGKNFSKGTCNPGF